MNISSNQNEDQKDDLTARTIKVSARPKTYKTFKDIANDKQEVDRFWQALQKREADASNLFLESINISPEDVESFNLNDDTKEFIIVLKTKKKEETPISDVEVLETVDNHK